MLARDCGLELLENASGLILCLNLAAGGGEPISITRSDASSTMMCGDGMYVLELDPSRLCFGFIAFAVAGAFHCSSSDEVTFSIALCPGLLLDVLVPARDLACCRFEATGLLVFGGPRATGFVSTFLLLEGPMKGDRREVADLLAANILDVPGRGLGMPVAESLGVDFSASAFLLASPRKCR